MYYKDDDGYRYEHKCGYTHDSTRCYLCGSADEIPMSSRLRKLLIALDNREEIWDKPYISMDRRKYKGELTYSEFEQIKGLDKIERED